MVGCLRVRDARLLGAQSSVELAFDGVAAATLAFGASSALTVPLSCSGLHHYPQLPLEQIETSFVPNTGSRSPPDFLVELCATDVNARKCSLPAV